MSVQKNALALMTLFLAFPIQAAELKGIVKLTKPSVKRTLIQMKADPVCVKQHGGKPVYSEDVVTSDTGSVANVFVYLKDGVKPTAQEQNPPPMVLDQKGCQYTPHVWGVRVNQPFTIRNSDPTLHNVHSLAKVNPNFNVGMATQGQKIEKKFTKPEVMVRIKCDVHGWMTTYVGVMDHPYYAVTDLSGSFSIKNLPPGEYQVAAWQEKLGEKIQKVTIGAGEDLKSIEFSY